MAETVLVTTHNLPLAGKLRDGFKGGGYKVDLFTGGEDPADVEDLVLLVFTGGADGKAARKQAKEARKLGVPVLAVVPAGAKGEDYPDVTIFHLEPAEPDELVLTGRKAAERNRLQKVTGIVGDTDSMVEVLERVGQMAPVDTTVLITGESGTGKELVARGLHALSRRRHRAFIPVNVAALPETLLESELFGHEKGAFTGAVDARRGLFELAHRGTIFLDEIGEMPSQTQTKLLRVLEHQEFLRVGGQKAIRVDARILAATNQRLPELVNLGGFRKDLFYRLNVLNIALPPLRARRADIPLLVDTFIREASERHDRGPFLGIAAEAMDILVGHSWPGNVRELRNLIESMVVLAPGRQIQAQDIPADLHTRVGSPTALIPIGESRQEGKEPANAFGELRPQVEVLFRHLMEMKVDIEDLRHEFETFRRARERDESWLIEPTSSVGGTDREIVYERQLDDEVKPTPAPDPDPFNDDSIDDSPAQESAADEDEDQAATVTYRPGMTLEEMERDTIRFVLNSVQGNRRQAAEVLGIGLRTLYRKLKKLGLDPE